MFASRIASRIASKAASKHVIEVACVALPKIANGGLQLATNIALIGFLAPAEFGRYAICLSSIILLDGVLGTSVDYGVVRLASDLRRDDLQRSFAIEAAALWVKVAVMAVVGAALVVLADPLAVALFHESGYTHLLFLTYVAGVGTMILRSSLVHLQLDLRFVRYGIVEWAHTIGRFGGAAAMFFLVERSVDSILVGYVVGPVFAFVLGIALLSRDWRWPFAPTIAAVRDLFAYLKWVAPPIVLGTLRDRSDVYFLTLWSTPTQVGIYSAARAIAVVPEVIGAYMSIVLSPRIMPLRREQRFFAFFKATQAGLVVLALVAAAAVYTGLGLAGPAIVPADYAASLPALEVLIVPALATFASYPLVLPFIMFVRPQSFLVFEAVAIPALVVGYALTIADMGALGAAWVLLVVRCLFTCAAQGYAWRLARGS